MTLLASSRCARCGGPVDRESYVIGYSRDTVMEWIYLCASCEPAFRRWLDRQPVDPQVDRRLGLRPERTA